jgi:crossover junction endodeoxyribonuclease RusA
MNIIKIELPLVPPSVNACYRSYKNRVYKSKKYREFEKEMNTYFENNKYEMLEGTLALDVTFYIKGRDKDIDNLLKALIDTLEGNVFENDKHIIDLHAKKINKCTNNRTVIILKTIDTHNRED